MSSVVERLNEALEGRYKIEEELGEGGMATVFLAEDLKHRRKVALKVLKPELAAVVGAERFLAEIETTANLQHPHILPLFDSGEADSFLFYVMPYVEGESLRDRLAREQQLPVDEALRITKAVAGALDYAHRQGVVHRDIKPANILLHEGEPLVADFGIALAVSQAGDGRITETGLSLGTPHYMSPEQAAGERTLDKRSDVYALGCVLYEMLTGQPPFGGPNAQAVLGRILTGDPDPVTTHRRAVPPNVEAAVHKALERLPADRFESASAFIRALEDAGFTTTVGTVTRGGAVAEARWRRRFGAAAVVAFLLLGVAAAGWLRGGGPSPPRPTVRFSQPLPFSGTAFQMDVSPDGSKLAVTYLATGRTYVRRLDALEFQEIDGVVGTQPRFSPDGESLVLTTPADELRVIALAAGLVRTVAEADAGLATAWGDDGYVYFAPGDGTALARVTGVGGRVDTLVTGDSATLGFTPHAVLPGGRGLLYAEARVGGTATTYMLDLETGGKEALFPAPSVRGVTYSPTGHILYANERFLLAQALDLTTLELVGEPVPVAEVPTGTMGFAYGGGLLAFTGAGSAGDLEPVIVDRENRRRRLPNLPEGSYSFPEVSPSGDRIALQRIQGQGGGGDVWVYDMPEGPLTRLSLQGDASTTSWSEDGEYLYFIRDGDAYRMKSDGSEEPELILDRERPLSRIVQAPGSDRIFYQEGPGEWDIGTATLGQEGSDSLILSGDYWEGHPATSPDGRWLAHYSRESGEIQVYVRPLFGPGRRHQVSRIQGSRPRWSSDGTELFYAGSENGRTTLFSASLDVGDDIDVRVIRPLMPMQDTDFDVFPGDSLFVILVSAGEEPTASPTVTVVLNFDTVLRGLGTGGRQ